MTSVLSPCDSLSTLTTPIEYNNKLFNTYLTSRLTHQYEQEEIVLYYNELQIHINSSLILNLVNTNSKTNIPIQDITMNHLIAYIIYYQINLLMNTAPIYINQIQLIHCGKKYRFTHHETSPKLDSLTNWQVTRKFHLLISPNVANNIYRYFNVENYLGEEAVDVVKKKVQKEIKEVIRGRVSGKWRGKKNSSGMSKVSVGIMKAIELFTL